jgi:hypothetical protein
MATEPNGALYPDDRPIADGENKPLIEAADHCRVPAADGRHLDHVSLDQLNPLLTLEDAGLSHRVEVVDRKPVAHGLGGPSELDHRLRLQGSVLVDL